MPTAAATTLTAAQIDQEIQRLEAEGPRLAERTADAIAAADTAERKRKALLLDVNVTGDPAAKRQAAAYHQQYQDAVQLRRDLEDTVSEVDARLGELRRQRAAVRRDEQRAERAAVGARLREKGAALDAAIEAIVPLVVDWIAEMQQAAQLNSDLGATNTRTGQMLAADAIAGRLHAILPKAFPKPTLREISFANASLWFVKG